MTSGANGGRVGESGKFKLGRSYVAAVALLEDGENRAAAESSFYLGPGHGCSTFQAGAIVEWAAGLLASHCRNLQESFCYEVRAELYEVLDSSAFSLRQDGRVLLGAWQRGLDVGEVAAAIVAACDEIAHEMKWRLTPGAVEVAEKLGAS